MSFADPQSVTINAVANSLPRTSTQGTQGVFTKDDGTRKLTVSHQYGKRTRRTIRLDDYKIAADPLTPAANVKNSMSAYLVVDLPAQGGYTVAEAKQIVDGLVGYLAASFGAKITQLLGGEN
jgi:hypothetical protein